MSEQEAQTTPQTADDQLAQLHEFADRYADRGQYRQTAKLAYRIVKRTFNIVFSLAVIVVLLVPGLILCLAIMLETKGSPIYVHERVGYHGRRLGVLKFRTMVADADDLEKYLCDWELAQFRREHKRGRADNRHAQPRAGFGRGACRGSRIFKNQTRRGKGSKGRR